VPAADRLRPNKKTAPPVTRKHPDKRREEDPISRPTSWPLDLPSQHSQLVAQDEDLDLVRGLRPAKQHAQPEEMPKQPVEK
jgi:hypothetical protein